MQARSFSFGRPIICSLAVRRFPIFERRKPLRALR